MLYLKLRCAASFTSVPLVASVGGGVIERAPDVNGLGFDRSTGFAGSQGRASTVRIEPFPRMPSYLAPCFRQDTHHQLLVQATRVRQTDTAVTAISDRRSRGTSDGVSSGGVRSLAAGAARRRPQPCPGACQRQQARGRGENGEHGDHRGEVLQGVDGMYALGSP